MKKLLLLVSVLTLGFTACNKDDETVVQPTDTNGTLEGRWEFLQQGSIVNGQELLNNYDHEEGCTKDFSEFLTGGGFINYDYYSSANGTNCNESVGSGSWTRSGNMLTVTTSGNTETVEIMTLNATTLKIKNTEQNGATTSVTVIVFKRIPNDDSNIVHQFEGTWEYTTEGVAYDGQTVLQDYQHTTECERDHAVISETMVTNFTYTLDNDGNCAQDITNTTYTRSGNTVTLTFDGEVSTAQITQLTATTLELRSTETSQGQTFEYITIFTRVN
jgi:hypothetical protein